MLKRDEREKGSHTDEIIAFLGKGTEFKGIITYEGTVRIDGKVKGEIITKGTLIVGETATVNADISAGTVISGGKISGSIRAHQKVHLLPKATFSGALSTLSLIIEDGVSFNAKCEMSGAGEEESAHVLETVGKSENGSKRENATK